MPTIVPYFPNRRANVHKIILAKKRVIGYKGEGKMKKEYTPKRPQNEHKKRRRKNILAVTALIATSLHLFQAEPDSLPGNKSMPDFTLASYGDIATRVGDLGQYMFDDYEVSSPGLVASALGPLPMVDQTLDSVGSDSGHEPAPPSPCSSSALCDDDVTPLPRLSTVPATPPEIIAVHPVAEVIDASAAQEPSSPDNPYYDRTLAPQEKWALAQQLAADACPSGSLSQTSYTLTAVMGDNHDGLLGYTDPNTHRISIDVRDGHRAIDVAETVVHEQAHARDLDGEVDRRSWLDGLGYGTFPYDDASRWFFGEYDPMAPGEAFGRLASSALLGVDVMNESMANSGYDQDPAAEKLLAQATPDQIVLAGELTGCFS